MQTMESLEDSMLAMEQTMGAWDENNAIAEPIRNTMHSTSILKSVKQLHYNPICIQKSHHMVHIQQFCMNLLLVQVPHLKTNLSWLSLALHP